MSTSYSADYVPARVDGPHDFARNRALGKLGEQRAAEHLEAQGLVVLSRNWRSPKGELDIVATDRRRLIVGEVKTRSGTGFGHPAEAITGTKARRLKVLALEWLWEHELGWCPVRFDVLAVLWPPNRTPRVEHFKGVF